MKQSKQQRCNIVREQPRLLDKLQTKAFVLVKYTLDHKVNGEWGGGGVGVLLVYIVGHSLWKKHPSKTKL